LCSHDYLVAGALIFLVAGVEYVDNELSMSNRKTDRRGYCADLVPSLRAELFYAPPVQPLINNVASSLPVGPKHFLRFGANKARSLIALHYLLIQYVFRKPIMSRAEPSARTLLPNSEYVHSFLSPVAKDLSVCFAQIRTLPTLRDLSSDDESRTIK
jgi:hypothetical protein